MDIRKLQRAIVDGLEDVKAQGILVFDTEHLSPLFERVIIASGTSNRQTKALAASVRDAVKGKGFPVPRTEGEDNGEWIIVDCGSAVVHVMQPAIREYYHLEEIWGGKPVRLKIDSGPTRLVKASEDAAPAAKKPAATKTAATKPAAKKPAAKKSPAAEAAPAKAPAATKTATKTAAKKAPAKKAPVKKPVTGKAAVTRVVGVKKSAAAKPADKKVAARKPAATKATAAKKAAPRKTTRA